MPHGGVKAEAKMPLDLDCAEGHEDRLRWPLAGCAA